MKARQIQTKIWRDSFYLGLPIEDKLLFMFYFTNEYVNVIHCYECPDMLTSFSTGLTIPQIIEIKKRLTKSIEFYKDYVYLKNAWKYERYEGADNENAKTKLINELSPDVRAWFEAKTTPLLHPSYTPKNKNKNYNKNQNQQFDVIDPDDIPL